MKKILFLFLNLISIFAFSQATVSGDGSLKPTGSFPLANTSDIKGGVKNVADLTARDAIPANMREIGTRVYVASVAKDYQLQGGILNANWVEVTGLNTVNDSILKYNSNAMLYFREAELSYKDSATNVTYTQIGDSKTERLDWQIDLQKNLTKYGFSSQGYLSANRTSSAYYTTAGLLNFAAGSNWQLGIDSNSIDGYAITGVSGDALFLAQNFGLSLMRHKKVTIFYIKNGGSFTWSVNSSNSGTALQSNTVTMANDNTLGQLVIDNIPAPISGEQIRTNLVATGNIKILGFFVENPDVSGLIINKVGHGGWNAYDFKNILNSWAIPKTILGVIHKKGIISLATGANDAAAYSLDVFQTHIESIVDVLKTYRTSVLLISQADMLNNSQAEIEKRLFRIAQSKSTAFFSQRPIYDNKYNSDFYSDGIHENLKGFSLNNQGLITYLNQSSIYTTDYTNPYFNFFDATKTGVKVSIGNNTANNRQLLISDNESGESLRVIGNSLNALNTKAGTTSILNLGASTTNTNLIGLKVNINNSVYIDNSNGNTSFGIDATTTDKVYINGSAFAQAYYIQGGGSLRVRGGGHLYFDNFNIGQSIIFRTNSASMNINDINNTVEMFSKLYVSNTTTFNNTVAFRNITTGVRGDSMGVFNGDVLKRLSIDDAIGRVQNSITVTVTITANDVYNVDIPITGLTTATGAFTYTCDAMPNAVSVKELVIPTNGTARIRLVNLTGSNVNLTSLVFKATSVKL